jgi:DNA-directed RNA polymerase specialized sigma24 family protein
MEVSLTTPPNVEGSARPSTQIAPCLPDASALITRIRANDETAVLELRTLIANGLRWFILRQLGCKRIGDYYVEEAFQAIVIGIREGNPRQPQDLLRYAIGVAREVAIASARTSASEDAPTRYAESPPDPQKLRTIKEIIARMPEGERGVLMRFYGNGQSEDQICRELGLTQVRFKSIKDYAKRQCMQPADDTKRRRKHRKASTWRESFGRPA